jgi:hypothetical protein
MFQFDDWHHSNTSDVNVELRQSDACHGIPARHVDVVVASGVWREIDLAAKICRIFGNRLLPALIVGVLRPVETRHHTFRSQLAHPAAFFSFGIAWTTDFHSK